MSDLFHAYIIGGERENARAHIEGELGDISVHGNPNVVSTEHVTFTIENARTLRQWQELRPAEGERKIYIAYTDFITREAENALLKTFEEPTLGTHIFLAIPNPEVLLETLRSRVRIVTALSAKKNGTEAKDFLALPMAERLAYVSKMIEKGDDDDASALVREKALEFIAGLEAELAKDAQKNRARIEAIYKLKKYLYIPGASVRIILESLALAL